MLAKTGASRPTDLGQVTGQAFTTRLPMADNRDAHLALAPRGKLALWGRQTAIVFQTGAIGNNRHGPLSEAKSGPSGGVARWVEGRKVASSVVPRDSMAG